MENSTPSKVNALLNLNYEESNELWLSNSYTLRKLIGILGMLLPVLLWVFLYFESQLNVPLESISHYYYTRAVSIFTIVVSLLAIFLMVYKGKEPVDFYISFTAGIFALCLLLFPTSNLVEACGDVNKKYCVTFLDGSAEPRVWFHYISAGIFLVCLAFMSLFLFTKSNKSVQDRGSKKILRNRIYRICGVIMILALFVIFSRLIGIFPKDLYNNNNFTFWMEVVAVEAFGFSWLVKGEVLLKD